MSQHQPVPKKPRLNYETPPPHFPHNHNLPPLPNPHFPTSQHQQESGQPLPKKPRLDYGTPRNGGFGSLFRKTRICVMFTRGGCGYGDKCTFAHGQGDLRMPPPNWKEIVENSNRNEDFGRDVNATDQKMHNWKIKLCHRFEKMGSCPHKDRCSYAHGIAELRNINRGVESSRANYGAAPMEPPTGPIPVSLPIEPQTTCMEGIEIEGEEEEEEEEGARPRWPKKMNGIYGDWPSYLTLLRG